jgi:hypothetical protein
LSVGFRLLPSPFSGWCSYGELQKKQGSMGEIAKENTAAIRENTEMLKAVLQKLDLRK